MPAKRPDELDTRTPLTTDFAIITPAGGPAYKCTVAAFVSGGGGSSGPYTINAQTGTSYTLVLGDAQQLVTLSNASAISLTVPTNASVAFPIGTSIDLIQLGAGQITVSGASVTLLATPGLKFRAQYSGASLIKTATNTWVLVGDTSA